MTVPPNIHRIKTKLSGALEEAANRAEATALLIRCGFKVYHPEADDEGEDLVLRTPSRQLIPVQLKSRVWVDQPRYGGRDIWMLFPSGPYDLAVSRTWYLVFHDELFAYVLNRHGSAPTWDGKWSYPYIPRHLAEFLEPHRIL